MRLLDTQTDIASVVGEAQTMAEKAYTVIGTAYKLLHDLDGDLELGFTFAGLIGLSNPVRPDSAAAIRSLGSMGVKTCIITNENMTSALAVAEECAIGRSGVVQGQSVELASLTGLRKSTIFADTPPAMKADFVSALNMGSESVVCAGRSSKDVVAMSRSDVSVSTEAGARVCSAAADINLTGSGLGRIASAIRECKRTFINNDRLIGYLLSCNAAEMLCALVPLAMGYSIPFTPQAIIWLNAVIATIGAVAIWREPYHRPRAHGRRELRSMKKGSIANSTVLGALLRGFVMGTAAMAVYIGLIGSVNIGERRNAVFLALCAAFTLTAQSCRSDDSILKRLKNNYSAYVCLLAGAGAILLSMLSGGVRDMLGIEKYTDSKVIALSLLAAAASFIVAELIKIIAKRENKKRK